VDDLYCGPLWAINLEQFAINSAKKQYVSESVQRARLKTEQRTPSVALALLGRFVIVAPSINVQTYLFIHTYKKIN